MPLKPGTSGSRPLPRLALDRGRDFKERWACPGDKDRPELIPGAVEETLRFDTSVPVWRRVTTRPVTLGGVDLPEGAKLFLWLASTGRDPDVFPEPNKIDFTRGARNHVAFGFGPHQ